MASLKAAILLHLLLLTLSHNLVSADESLIRTECHNAEVPSICIKCVKSDQDAEKVDRLGIATIVVNCISKQGKTLVANMTSLASKTKDPKMKSLFHDCAHWYSSTEDNLTLAKTALENHKYDNAERSVVEALKSDVACHNRIPTIHHSQIYCDLVFEINIYEELSEAALRIIERF